MIHGPPRRRGHAQTRADVFRRFVRGQHLDRALEADALFELSQIRLSEQVVKLRLPAQNDLKQLVAIGFKVREQPDLFKQVPRQEVRFVDDKHRAKPLRVTRHQRIAEHTEH